MNAKSAHGEKYQLHAMFIVLKKIKDLHKFIVQCWDLGGLNSLQANKSHKLHGKPLKTLCR